MGFRLSLALRFIFPAFVLAGGLSARSEDKPAPGGSDEARIDEILTALQQRNDDLKDIRCELRLEEADHINLSNSVKSGKLMFMMAEPNPHFSIRFDKIEMDGVLGKREWYLFDGYWLNQGVERIAQVTKQELAKPGDKLDFFNLERMPFPVPFGQKKETILRNFSVGLVSPGRGDPPETDHLACTPKPGSKLARRYDRLDLFVNRKVHLPSRIVVTKSEGNAVSSINTADFPDLSVKSINTGLTKDDFKPPPEWKSYKEVVEELVPDEK